MDLKNRLLAAVAAEPSRPRSAFRRRRIVALAAAALISLTMLVLVRGVPANASPASLGAAVIAAVGLAAALRPGPSMLGRPQVVQLALPALLLAWNLAVSSQAAPRPWDECIVLALATGIAPLVALIDLRRGTAAAHPRITGWVLGTAAGAFSWLLVDLGCPAGQIDHLLLGHLLPLVLLAAAGALAGAPLR
jgi:hypothetical protein